MGKKRKLNSYETNKVNRLSNDEKWFFDDIFTKKVDIGNQSRAKKIIFLDIDGVLNDNKNNKVLVEEERIKRVKKIIDATGAEVVLSSSRRLIYWKYLNLENYTDRDMEKFQSLLDKYDIKIIDNTPEFNLFGYETRPYEIKAWLMNNPRIESFVILDDDPWTWRWLSHFVVRTARPIPNEKYEKLYGLEDEDVERAIEILNRDPTKNEKEEEK